VGGQGAAVSRSATGSPDTLQPYLRQRSAAQLQAFALFHFLLIYIYLAVFILSLHLNIVLLILAQQLKNYFFSFTFPYPAQQRSINLCRLLKRFSIVDCALLPSDSCVIAGIHYSTLSLAIMQFDCAALTLLFN